MKTTTATNATTAENNRIYIIIGLTICVLQLAYHIIAEVIMPLA